MTTEREAFEVWHAEWRASVSAREPSATEAWQAACAWQRERDEAICTEFSQNAYARYRASRREYNDGQYNAANTLADKIRSGE